MLTTVQPYTESVVVDNTLINKQHGTFIPGLTIVTCKEAHL